MLRKFNKIYGIPEDIPFKRVELENALIEKYENLTYNRFGGWESSDKKIKYEATYHVGTKERWGLQEICTDYEYHGSNPEEALLALFIKYGVEPNEKSEEYYKDNHYKEFQELVKKVYKGC